MRIEELPHIKVKRTKYTDEELKRYYITKERKKFFKKHGYIPQIDCMADSYSSISRVLDKDCVVAYFTDKSQTTFLIKTRCKYVGFVCISDKLAQILSSNSTRTITMMTDWNCEEGFMKYVEGEDLVIVDKDLWEKHLKLKLLESLSK